MQIQNVLGVCLFLALGISYSVQAQSDCKVYPSKITDHYTGECKKGLAHGIGKAEGIDIYEGKFKKGYPHGEGTYTWKNGDVYIGEFERGRKEGEGKLSFTTHGKDTTIIGYWRSDEYIGLVYEAPYKVLEKVSIERISFNHAESDRDEITIMFYQNGVRNNGVSNKMIQNTNGNYQTEGSSWVRFYNIELPFEGKITYQTQNKLKTSTVYCSFGFKISQKGKWEIRIHN